MRPPDSVFCYSLLTAFADTMKDIDLRPVVHFRDHGLPLPDRSLLDPKAVRECPRGACADCKRKKTKARDPLVTNLVFYTLTSVPSALTGYQRTWPWSRLTDGL